MSISDPHISQINLFIMLKIKLHQQMVLENVFHCITAYPQASKFQIECTYPLGKWIVKITCPNISFTCLKYIKPMQLIWKSEIHSRLSDKSCRYPTCPTVIFTRLRRLDVKFQTLIRILKLWYCPLTLAWKCSVLRFKVDNEWFCNIYFS